MKTLKRLLFILLILTVTMLGLPLLAVYTVKAEAGMLLMLCMFFVLYPAVSIVVGILAGKYIRKLWAVPLLVGVLFWCFSSLVYQTAFPIVYSLIYFVGCSISMVVTKLVTRERK